MKLHELKGGIRIILVFLVIFSSRAVAKKKESSVDFLENEKKKLTAKGITCSLKKLTTKSLHNLRLTKEPDTVIPCIIDTLIGGKQSDGVLWSLLGSAYNKKDSTTQASTCFKQALKLNGKISQFIKEWSFIGPFVIGKLELDGDPLEAHGSIYNVSKYRHQKDIKFYSELIDGGEIKWKTYTQSSGNEIVKISPQINWNDLVSSLGSMGITEWQGWVVGDFFVNEKDQNIIIQCLGVHTVYVDDVPLTGDVYHRDQFWSSVHLSPGVHSLYIRLRTKVAASFKCSIKLAATSIQVLSPHFMPDLVDGYLFGRYIAIPIANYHHSKFIKVTKVSVLDQSVGEMLDTNIVSTITIAPGQIYPITVQLTTEADNSRILSSCSDIDIELKISTSEGIQSKDLKLRCRKSDESFLFTFVDHDGSVQHAAAIQPIGGCGFNKCPILLTLHGTTVPPQNQADSYKQMIGNKFVFGVQGTWVLAPTRHGAHNWEGPGALTAITAVDHLISLSDSSTWITDKADPQRLIYAGHSMGGHGSWHLATHFPDRGLALLSLAGWIKKEEYGDSNLFFKHDISTSHTDPAVKYIMEACIAENDADRHVSNIQDIPVLTRIGANDRTVHPFFMRRMYRLLKESRINVSYTELPGKEHWWWDTRDTNDGGVVNDKQLRDFTSLYSASAQSTCDSEDGECKDKKSNIYVDQNKHFTLTTYNPAFGDGYNGVRILQQKTPFRLSKIQGDVDNDEIKLSTTNVAKFTISEPPNRSINWKGKKLLVDGDGISKDNLIKLLDHQDFCLNKVKGLWKLENCTDSQKNGIRLAETYGPARRVAEKPFIIIIGTQGNNRITKYLQRLAVYIANLFFLTSDTAVSISKDSEVNMKETENKNLIIMGGPSENSLASQFLQMIPLNINGNKINLEDCYFNEERSGYLSLAPHGSKNLALLIMGNSIRGLLDAVTLATPTIPPMTRSPFSNLLPDFVITGPDFGLKGPGGFLCAGFWGNRWEYRSDISSCVCDIV